MLGLVNPTPGTATVLPRLLDAAEDASPVDAVEAVTRELATSLGAKSASLLITDLTGRALARLAHVPWGALVAGRGTAMPRREGEEAAVVIPLDGGPPDQALRSQAVQVLAPGSWNLAVSAECWTVLAPVTERGEALGLLELALDGEPEADVVEEIARTAHVLAFVVIANRRHTDLYEWAQRRTPFSLSAEIQRRLLPPAFTCEGGSFTLSAWLEPAATIGGDTFDYSLGRDVLHLTVTDAMGHGLASALTATLCVSSLRSSRRQGASLSEQARAANVALAEQAATAGIEGFVTGLLGTLDLRTGALEVINAGHVGPYLARDGRVRLLDLPAGPPMGAFLESTYDGTTVMLHPGDRLVLVTDGMLERGAASLDLPAELLRTRQLHAREATRGLADKVLDVVGPTLSDDATLLVLDWHGGHGRPRTTTAGADRDGTT
jgi:serine phosphatase RsbU (regulator of sigma subunit)